MLLEREGFADVMNWSPRRLLFVSRVVWEDEGDRQRSQLKSAAIANRLGQADKKGWTEAMKSLDPED